MRSIVFSLVFMLSRSCCFSFLQMAHKITPRSIQSKYISQVNTGFRSLFVSLAVTLPLSASRAYASSSSSSFTSTGILSPSFSPIDPNKVIKSSIDSREYKAITLKNGLRVLLISDPEAVRAAAALNVHVGSLCDPPSIPGLAHFCEHMLFLGTKKFPKEDEYSSFLNTHGGSSNAYTSSEDTCFYFDINAAYLPPALDRFSQFFISPLFTEAATSRELNAVDSEHSKNINNDGFRLYQVIIDAS